MCIRDSVKTNIPLGDMTAYLTKIPNFSSSKIHSYILPGDYKDDGISWYMADEEQLPEIVDRLFAEYKLDDQTTNCLLYTSDAADEVRRV